MTLIEQLVQTVLREAPGSHAPDPSVTPSDANHEVQFTLRLETGDESVVLYIPRGANLEGRRAITRVENAFRRATNLDVQVKLLNGR